MDNKTIVIFGSARREGSNTSHAMDLVLAGQDVPVVDLQQYNISYFDYEHRNQDDDFLPLLEKIISFEQIIFVTPVYWYSMSAIMKTFFDRLSDALSIRKDLGRALAGKEVFVITSYGESIPKGFEDPFSQTCAYLKMHYRGCFYYYGGKKQEFSSQNQSLATEFSKLIFV